MSKVAFEGKHYLTLHGAVVRVTAVIAEGTYVVVCMVNSSGDCFSNERMGASLLKEEISAEDARTRALRYVTAKVAILLGTSEEGSH